MPGDTGPQFSEKAKEGDVRTSNILAAKAVADLVRTSLGPRGMDKMLQDERGEVTITNDGATIMKQLSVIHPAAKMMVELSNAQDVEAGDGTTSVVVLAGALLHCSTRLIKKGIHASVIADAFQKAVIKSREILRSVAKPVDLSDAALLRDMASTALNSKVVASSSPKLAQIAVDAVLRVIDPKTATNVDLSAVKVVCKLGGTCEETELVDGLIFTQGVANRGAPSFIENAKIALIQFCLSPPKPNIDNQVVITDYVQMDRALNEETRYIQNLCRQVKRTGCNVLLVQKSILRDAVTDLSLELLSKHKIMVIRDVERSEIELIAGSLGCQPIASLEALDKKKLGTAAIVQCEGTSGGRVVKMTGVPNPGKAVTVFCRGSNKLMLDECHRSIHDAMCVIRSLVKERHMIAGGGAAETELAIRLHEWAKTQTGMDATCIRAYAEALEIIPYTLAENAGLSPISIVTELRKKHVEGVVTAGINVRRGTITDMMTETVVQPLLVTLSALTLATETTAMILKIDDIIAVR